MSEQYVKINTLSEGINVVGIYMIADSQRRQRNNGADFLSLKLADKTGEIDCPVWDPDWQAFDRGDFAAGKFVAVSARVGKFREALNFKLEAMEPVPVPADTSEWVSAPRVNVIELSWKFTKTLESITCDPIRRIVGRVFEDQAFWMEYLAAPAGAKLHSAYKGGLIEHTLRVLDNAVKLAEQYPFVCLDLLKAGALLHDVGKVRQYTMDGPVPGYHPVHGMNSHIVEGLRMVERAVMSLEAEPGTTPEGVQALKKWSHFIAHLIASHHGKLEHGSPCLPQMPEAMLLHYADAAECYVSSWKEVSEKEPKGAQTSQWSKVHGSTLYVGDLPPCVSLGSVDAGAGVDHLVNGE